MPETTSPPNRVAPSANTRWRRRLSLWLPVVAWLAVIALMSTDTGSRSSTEGSFLDLLSAWWPALAASLQGAGWWEAAGWAVRKAAHLTEYGVLALLAGRAVWGDTRLRGLAASSAVFLVCVLVASGDEFHQATVASRSGSLVDVGIDLTGVLLVLGAAALARRRRRRDLEGRGQDPTKVA